MRRPEGAPTEVGQERDLYLRLLELGFHDRVEPFLEEALLLLIQTAGARRAAIRIWNGASADEEPLFSLERGLEDQDDLAFSQSVITEAFATGETIVTASALDDPRFRQQGSVRGKRLEAVLCAPIGHRPIAGVLYLQDRLESGPFSESDRRRTETFARHLAVFVERLVLRQQRRGALDETLELRRALKADAIIGRSQSVAMLLRQVALIAPLRITVLITGPSGAGKTQLARVIHDNGPLASAPFVELNCGAIPETLIESELFGSVAGAHATATKRIPGKLAAAEGGTLFLDEIGDLPWRAQASLLQVLQSKTYFPLGSSTACRANVRIVAATHIELEAAIAERRFREDLFHRLNVFQIRVPGLVERREDIVELAEHLCRRACESFDIAPLGLSPSAFRAVEAADWQGEIRELANTMQGAVIRANGEKSSTIERRHLFPHAAPADADTAEPETFHVATRRFQERLVREALERAGGNVSAAARALSITRAHVYNLMSMFGIRRES